MTRTIHARVTQGMLRPLEPLGLAEGSEVELTLSFPVESKGAAEAIQATSGAWAELLDCETFERDLYERRHRGRPPVRL